MAEAHMRVPARQLYDEFLKILTGNGFPSDQAEICAAVFLNNSLDGVYSHGVTRFPKFIRQLQHGHIKPGNRAVCKSRAGSIEQWDGLSAPGPVNALICTRRAVALAKETGIACVALANTNHWLRGGTYGWEAAKEGCVFIGWSNTIANMPAWGASDPKLGNNPLVIAVPMQDEAIVLDMAMSQYSYGALEMYDLKNERLPVPGGYDTSGELSTDPGEIRKSQRPLPVGYWKGSGLSLLLDVLGTILSSGLSTAAITKQGGEYNLSQVFIAIDITRLETFGTIASAIEGIIADYHRSVSVSDGPSHVRYPGEKVIVTRKENNMLGVPILKSVWDEIVSLSREAI